MHPHADAARGRSAAARQAPPVRAARAASRRRRVGQQRLRRRSRRPDAAHGREARDLARDGRKHSVPPALVRLRGDDGWLDRSGRRLSHGLGIRRRRARQPGTRRRARPESRTRVHPRPRLRPQPPSRHDDAGAVARLSVRRPPRPLRRAVGTGVSPHGAARRDERRRRPPVPREPPSPVGARGQDLSGRDDRLPLHPVGRGQGRRRRDGRLPPGVDARHGEQRDRAPGVRRHRNAAARAHLSRVLAAGGRRIPPELLDQRGAILAGHAARRGGVSDPARVEAPRGRGAPRFRPVSDGAARRRLSDRAWSRDAAGAVGGEQRLLPVDAGSGNRRAHVRGIVRARARGRGNGRVPPAARRFRRVPRRSLDRHHRRDVGARHRATFHSDPARGPERSRAGRGPEPRRHDDPQSASRRARGVSGEGHRRRGLSRARPVRNPEGRRSPHRGLAARRGRDAQGRYAGRAVVAPLQPRRLWTA